MDGSDPVSFRQSSVEDNHNIPGESHNSQASRSRRGYNRHPSYASIPAHELPQHREYEQLSEFRDYVKERFSNPVEEDQDIGVSYALLQNISETLYALTGIGGIKDGDNNISVNSIGRRRSNYLLNWWPEMLGCATSVVALIALSITVYKYDRRQSPNWPNWLSINTVVSIYVILLKTGVVTVAAQGISQLKWSHFAQGRPQPLEDLAIYDNSSRGISGSLALIWRLKLSHRLSSIGALLIVVTVAVDPFAQQIIGYYNCPVLAKNTRASIPGTSYLLLDSTSTSKFDSSFIAGVVAPPGPPPAECSTGNCHWNTRYDSLGWCSECKDITSAVHVTETHGNASTGSIGSLEGQSPPLSDAPHISNNHSATLTTEIPRGGISLTVPISRHRNISSWPVAAMRRSPRKNMQYQSNPFDAVSIDFLLAKQPHNESKRLPQCESGNTDQSWSCRGFGAARCRLYPCVKSYHHAKVENGKLSEKNLASSEEWGVVLHLNRDGSTKDALLGMLDAHRLTSTDKRYLKNVNYTIERHERWIPYYFDLTQEGLEKSLFNRGCLYVVGLANYSPSKLSNVAPSTFDGVVRKRRSGHHAGPPWLQAMYDGGNVTFDRLVSNFEDVALSTTNYVRQNGVPGFNAPAIGETYVLETCIRVRFPWLIYPSILVIWSIVFFILMARETRPTSSRPEIWKSSSLALFYHGPIGGWDADDAKASATRDLTDMKNLAKKTKVKLSMSSDHGTRLEVVNQGEIEPGLELRPRAS